MKTTYLTLISAAAMLAASLPAAAQNGNFASNGTTSVNVSIAAEAAIRIDTGSTALSTSGVGFTSDYTGATNFTYKIRTQKSGGTGTITLKVTADFPSGGPSVASPPTPGDTLQYTCAVTSPGAACSGSQTASTTASTPLATFGADAKSVKAGTGGNSVNWTLTNDPAYSTGSYAATVTLTISAA